MRVEELKQIMEEIKGRGSSSTTGETRELMIFIENRLKEVLKKEGTE